MRHPLEKEVRLAQILAREAGKLAMALKSGARHFAKENGEGPVSEADLQADALICKGLKADFPNDFIISEEGAQKNDALPAQGRVWLVDPIDGTADYVAGGQDYCVMIGLLIDALPVLGIVYSPESDELWTGVLWQDEAGEHRFFEKEPAFGPPDPRKGLIVAISKHHPSRIIDEIVSLLEPEQLIKKGSLGLKIALIADKKADFYAAASRKIKVWDTCAPFAILKAAGGVALTFDGQALRFGPTLTHDSPFFAASEAFAPSALQKLADYLYRYSPPGTKGVAK